MWRLARPSARLIGRLVCVIRDGKRVSCTDAVGVPALGCIALRHDEKTIARDNRQGGKTGEGFELDPVRQFGRNR